MVDDGLDPNFTATIDDQRERRMDGLTWLGAGLALEPAGRVGLVTGLVSLVVTYAEDSRKRRPGAGTGPIGRRC